MVLYRPRETFKFSSEYYREPMLLEKYDLYLLLSVQQFGINFGVSLNFFGQPGNEQLQ